MKNLDKKGWIITGCVSVIFSLLGALAVYANITAKKYDPTTLCPYEEIDYPVVRVLIDKTDPWDSRRSERLEKIIRKIKNNLALSERMAIFVLDESGSEVPNPVFDMCNPGRGDQVNHLYKNPRRVQQKFENQFDKPLEEMLADILKPGTAPRSPILEAINNFPDAGDNGRLVVISDLMQNTAQLSFYRAEYANNFDIYRPDNHYKAIDIYYIDRDNISQKQKSLSVRFFKQYFNQMTSSLAFYKI